MANVERSYRKVSIVKKPIDIDVCENHGRITTQDVIVNSRMTGNAKTYRSRYSRNDNWGKQVLSKREGMRQPHFNSFLSASCSNTQDIATANSVPRTESNFATITFTESITE